ncbi:succinylglutamate desuccinylase/aspartoacylase family protein [Alteromonadaceae bacterium M269]|nr:succinylglutamate desuccinylase/aspartoacylase family protein [Alteromonadaceae bacterium M269]
MPECTKDYLVVAQNASGRNLNVPVYRFVGEKPGPKVYIQSSIHGAEVQGNVVIYHLIEALKHAELKGEIILVPNCNPVGSNIKSGEYTLGRFDPVNGQNWNRGYFFDESLIRNFAETVNIEQPLPELKKQFRQSIKDAIDNRLAEPWGIGLAQRLNLKLQRFAFDADIVLDLHNGPVSTRHIYVPEYARESAKYFNIANVILIPNLFAGALDEATFCQWWKLQEELNQIAPEKQWDFNVEAFTMEMGSQEVIDFNAGHYDAQSVLSYLNHKGCFDNASYQPDDIERVAVYLKDYKIMYSQQGGIVEYLAKPGEKVQQGQIMAKVLNIDELDNAKAVEDIKAPCDLIPILHFPSASILGGTQLYKCFTHYFEL